MSGGQLIFLPEISQENLNSFCHVIFCAMNSKTEYQDNAQIIYRNLKARNKLIEAILGEGGSDPRKLGAVLVEYQSLPNPKTLQPFLKDVRLLPLQVKFGKQLDVWAKSAMSKMAVLS
jgi:intracellular multiplication protein IcmJ